MKPFEIQFDWYFIQMFLTVHGLHQAQEIVCMTEPFLMLVLVSVLHNDGLVQDRCNSSVLAMELGLTCTNPSMYTYSL